LSKNWVENSGLCYRDREVKDFRQPLSSAQNPACRASKLELPGTTADMPDRSNGRPTLDSQQAGRAQKTAHSTGGLVLHSISSLVKDW